MCFRLTITFVAALVASSASAQVIRVGELNTRQIRALDRDKTVVFLQGGMLEEHGPYLPAFTDGILSDRLTRELAQGVVAQKPGWTALVFPLVSVGASGSNEIGKQFVFPGTYAVRPSTLRAMFMDPWRNGSGKVPALSFLSEEAAALSRLDRLGERARRITRAEAARMAGS